MRVWLLAILLGSTGCSATVVTETGGSGGSGGTGTGTAPDGLQGDTRIATMRDTSVVVVDAEGGLVLGWTQNTFFSPLDAHISPSGDEIGFGVRPDQFDPDYISIVGPIGQPTIVPNATPTGDVVPLGQGAVAWIDGDAIRITDRSGAPLTGDSVAFTGALDLIPSRDGRAVYAMAGGFNDGPVQRVDLDTGTVRELGATEVPRRFDVNAGGEVVAGSGGDVVVIDDAGDLRVLCTFPSTEDGCDFDDPDLDRGCFFYPQNPQWSPDGTRVVFDAGRTIDHLAGRDIFVCQSGVADPIRITNDDVRDRYPVFDASGERVIWNRAGDLVRASADGTTEPAVLVAEGFSDELDVAWLD